MYKVYASLLVCCLMAVLSCSRNHFSFDALFCKVGVYNMVVGNAVVDSSQYPVAVALPLIIVNGGDEQKIDISLSAVDLGDCQNSLNFETSLLIPESSFVYETKLNLRLTNGFYRIRGTLSDGTFEKKIVTEVGVIPPPVAGLRKDSFFSSNTSHLRTGDELKLLQLMGIKVQRTHFHPNQNFAHVTPSNNPLPLDFSEQDRNFKESVDHGIWALPIVGYAFVGTRSARAQAMNMHGPPRHYGEFVQSWKTILQHYPEIDTYEFWNEPWIYGWTWADDAASYRLLHNKWIRMARNLIPGVKIIAGNSCMFVEDHLELFPETYKNRLTGISHHPYSGADLKSLRQSGQARSIDYGFLTNKRLGLERYYITEGGTLHFTDHSALSDSIQKRISDLVDDVKGLSAGDEYLNFINTYNSLKKSLYDINITPEKKSTVLSEIKKLVIYIFGKREKGSEETTLFFKYWEEINERTDILYSIPISQNSNINTAKCIQYQFRSFLSGAFQGNMQWEIGYGPGWTRCNTAVAVFNHFIEDRPVVADIWPQHELIYGAIFANPKHITEGVKGLPRANELSSRWKVEIPQERVMDSTLVAVIYSNTGRDYNHPDKYGTLSIKNAHHIKAFDISGRPIANRGDVLKVPFNQYAVYLTTNKLTVLEFRERIASARIDTLTPLNVYATSLFKPVEHLQNLIIRVENQLNRSLKGRLWLQLTDSSFTPPADFKLEPAQLVNVNLIWPGFAGNAMNSYPVSIIAEVNGQRYQKEQIISVAFFSKITAIIDAELSEWQNVQPVIIDSYLLKTGIDLTQYLLNPNMAKPGSISEGKRIVAKVYAGYDNNNIYLAAEVFEEQLHNQAGGVFSINGVLTEFQQGVPDGFNHIRFNGDALFFAFGYRDRVPGWGRQMDDSYAWKGHFYDSDYTYVAHVSTQGDRLVRLWGKNTGRRNAYQGVKVAGTGTIPGAKIKIRRDINRGCSIYELSIPLKEMDLFDAHANSLRFSFMITNDEGVGTSGTLNWSQAAGVFDYWCSSGSFGPTWQSDLPCQTFWGIAK
jgi:hypothetical protein